MSYYKKCFECNNFIKVGDTWFINNINFKSCLEHKGKEIMTKEEYVFLTSK